MSHKCCSASGRIELITNSKWLQHAANHVYRICKTDIRLKQPQEHPSENSMRIEWDDNNVNSRIRKWNEKCWQLKASVVEKFSIIDDNLIYWSSTIFWLHIRQHSYNYLVSTASIRTFTFCCFIDDLMQFRFIFANGKVHANRLRCSNGHSKNSECNIELVEILIYKCQTWYHKCNHRQQIMITD